MVGERDLRGRYIRTISDENLEIEFLAGLVSPCQGNEARQTGSGFKQGRRNKPPT